MKKAHNLGNSAVSNLEANSIISDFSFSSQLYSFYSVNVSVFKKKMDQKKRHLKV